MTLAPERVTRQCMFMYPKGGLPTILDGETGRESACVPLPDHSVPGQQGNTAQSL